MSKIDDLIKQYCPDAVEYRTLDELGYFYSGLSGKSKKDFENGNYKFITYVNIYKNPALNTDVEDKVLIQEGERQNSIQYGDVLFTGSSETPDECGFSSVVVKEVNEKMKLGKVDCPLPNNDKEYIRRHKWKMSMYESIGIVPWKNLIVTYDMMQDNNEVGLFDSRIIDTEIVTKLM